jgi:hypothetical protein
MAFTHGRFLSFRHEFVWFRVTVSDPPRAGFSHVGWGENVETDSTWLGERRPTTKYPAEAVAVHHHPMTVEVLSEGSYRRHRTTAEPSVSPTRYTDWRFDEGRLRTNLDDPVRNQPSAPAGVFAHRSSLDRALIPSEPKRAGTYASENRPANSFVRNKLCQRYLLGV